MMRFSVQLVFLHGLCEKEFSSYTLMVQLDRRAHVPHLKDVTKDNGNYRGVKVVLHFLLRILLNIFQYYSIQFDVRKPKKCQSKPKQ